MIYKFTEKNKFGGDTWQIKVDALFHIYINSTNNNSYFVEIKEWKWVSYKTRNSYISVSDLETTIRQSFQRLQDYLNGTGRFQWSDRQRNSKLETVLSTLDEYSDLLIPIRRRYSELLAEFEDSKDAHVISETDNYIKFYWEFPESNTRSTYAVKDVDDKLRVEWSQKGRLGDLEEFWDFPISLPQKEIKNLVNQKITAITSAAARNKLAASFQKEKENDREYAAERISSAKAFDIPPDIVEPSQTEVDSSISSGFPEGQNKSFNLSLYLMNFILEKRKEESTVGEYLEALIFASYMVATKMEPTSEVDSNRESMLNQLYLCVVEHDTLPYMIDSDIKVFLSERYITIQEEMLEFENSSEYYFPKLVNNLYIDSLNQSNPSVDKILEKLKLDTALEFKRKLTFFLQRLDKTIKWA